MQSQQNPSRTPIERARAWALANPERRKEIALRSYLKLRPELKPVKTPIERFESLIERVPLAGCWLWTGAVNKNGYGKVKIERKHLTAHRWSWMIHKGSIPDGLHVLHRCDVPGCVNPEHLWLGTNKDNDADKRAKGRHFVQPIHREAKLTDEQVQEIRRLHGKESIVGLAKKFGVHHSQISRIQNRKVWKHLGEEEAYA